MLETFFPEGSWSGRHRAIGDIATAGAFAGFELGNHPEPAGIGSANLAIAERIAADHAGRDIPIITSRSIANGLYRLGYADNDVTVFSGPSASGISEHTGTYGELGQLVSMLGERKIDTAALYSSAYNIGNIWRQSGLIAARQLQLGKRITFVVPPNLPPVLDPESVGQPWARGRIRWAAATVLRVYLLQRRGH